MQKWELVGAYILLKIKEITKILLSNLCFGYFRAVCTVLGISSFYLSKTSVTKKRYENMKVRERMRLANDTDYQPSYRKFSS